MNEKKLNIIKRVLGVYDWKVSEPHPHIFYVQNKEDNQIITFKEKYERCWVDHEFLLEDFGTILGLTNNEKTIKMLEALLGDILNREVKIKKLFC